jgi:tRNA-dihydrouridine synthase 4
MIVSSSFVRSNKARDSEFTTNANDRPLIVQFAASTADDFASATELVRPYSDGVNLNCGCPQSWALKEGIGASLIKKADLVCEMIREARKRVQHDAEYTVSAKIRIHDDMK